MTTSYVAETPAGPPQIPLPGNDDNRGSEGVVGRVMSVVAGRGFFPDGKAPEHPTNIQVPPMQRTNAAHTHFYTKVCRPLDHMSKSNELGEQNLPFDVKVWNESHRLQTKPDNVRIE